MGNNKCKPVDFDGVCAMINTVPFKSLSNEEKDGIVRMIMPVILVGKDDAYGFDISLIYAYVSPYTRVDLRDAIVYAMKTLAITRPYVVVKNQRDVKYHVLFVEDL
jgi:hypothetical protein